MPAVAWRMSKLAFLDVQSKCLIQSVTMKMAFVSMFLDMIGNFITGTSLVRFVKLDNGLLDLVEEKQMKPYALIMMTG